jgi:hypothetical protein
MKNKIKMNMTIEKTILKFIQYFPGLRPLGCEGDHSPPCSDEVENYRCTTSASPYAFVQWC